MLEPKYTYKAKIIDVYDPDTVTAKIDLGFHASLVMKIRVKGIDAVEKRGKNRIPGKIVAKWAEKKLLNKDVIIRTYKKGKYYRYIADVEIDGKNWGDIVIGKGYAKEYDGGTKSEWSKKELDYIIKNNKQ